MKVALPLHGRARHGVLAAKPGWIVVALAHDTLLRVGVAQAAPVHALMLRLAHPLPSEARRKEA